MSEMGSMLCHLAIVSRIRKIPAIIKVKNATSTIKDHERITVNAYNGFIYRGLHEDQLRNEGSLGFIQEFYGKISKKDQ